MIGLFGRLRSGRLFSIPCGKSVGPVIALNIVTRLRRYLVPFDPGCRWDLRKGLESIVDDGKVVRIAPLFSGRLRGTHVHLRDSRFAIGDPSVPWRRRQKTVQHLHYQHRCGKSPQLTSSGVGSVEGTVNRSCPFI